MTNEIDIAYAAGLFDGEGCVSTLWPSRWQARLEIQMVHKPTLDRFASIVGGNVNKSYEHRRGRRTQWRWRVHDNKAVDVATLILPFCTEKKLQLMALVEFKATKCRDERGRIADFIKAEKHNEFT